MVKTAFSAIVAGLDLNGGIGVNNTLLAKIPEDLKHFRDLTLDSIVVMGRNTYASLPKGALDRRTNIIITSDDASNYPGCIVYSEVHQVFSHHEKEKIFFIGGAKLYEAVLDYVDRLYLTEIDFVFLECDTFFPKVDWTKWELVSKISLSEKPYRSSLCEYKRKL